MKNNKTYIHYGSKHFDKGKFVTIKNENWVKPRGGLWASNINAKYGWKDWNEDNSFSDCDKNNSFTFQLKEGSNVLTINSREDLLEKTPMLNNFCLLGSQIYYIDFEGLIKEGIDAIEVNISKDDNLYWDLYGWDCDSILLLNPNIVEETKG